jgi:hypothetical protein
MLDFSDRLSGCKVFSKINLQKCYWQIPVKPEDRKKTVIITPFGLFKFLEMPFGLPMQAAAFRADGLGFGQPPFCLLLLG